jgi:hypothetical protein
VLIRARAAPGHAVLFHTGGRTFLRNELRWPLPRVPGHWRYGVTTTAVSGPGCYAFQVDGLGFSYLIAFEARH